MKPGRNDRCPCGSGKKYKHCCLNADDGRDLVWRRVRRAIDGFPTRMFKFVSDCYGPVAIDEAWDAFNLWEIDEPFGKDSPHLGLFLSWLIYCWSPDPHETEVADEALHDVRPIDAFVERQGMGADPLLLLYAETCASSAFSFFEVEDIQAGRGFTVHDLLTGERHSVLERSAAEVLRPGDLMYGLLAPMEAVTLMEACGPVAFPPSSRIEVIELRELFKSQAGTLDSDVIAEFDAELRELYLSLTQRCLNPQVPQLQNTDGEPLLLQDLVFDIDSPQTVFDALKHLDIDSTEAEQLADEHRDAHGQLQGVSFCWKRAGNAKHADWNHTILGRIEISDRRLSVQVNSEARAKRIREIIEQATGGQARYRMAEVHSAEKLMGQALQQPPAERDPEEDEFLRHPELAAHLNRTIAAHYEHWADQCLPALGGQTPRQAALEAVGQEKVEALIRDIERISASMVSAPDPAIFIRLRQTLGMPCP